jgi:hypothetical protein
MSLRTSLVTAFASAFIVAGLASAASAPRTAAFPLAPGITPPPSLITGNGFYVSATTIGYDGSSSGLPCFFCGPGSSIAIPYPITIFTPGIAYQIVAQFYSSIYSGTPIISEVTTVGGVVVDRQTVVFSGPFGPGYVGYAYFLGTTAATGSGTIYIEATDSVTGLALCNGGTKFGVE